jgi:CRP/FNR family transcriptional regulator, cyclic AMP receptor protein
MAEIKQTSALLQNVPLFRSLNKKQLNFLATRFVERHYPAGQDIVTQGRGGEGFFVVVSGRVDVIRTTQDGERHVVNTFGPMDFFGEMALLDDGPRTATVTTTEPTDCLVLTHWDFHAALKEDSDLTLEILKELARRFRVALESL